MSRSAFAFAVAVIAVHLVIAGCQSSSESSSRAADYNFVLISVDALRADHLGAYGYDRATTPFLDSLATDSVVFDRAYAPSSFTGQSVSSLLTGRLPTSGGSVSLAAQPHENAETLAGLFRVAGYRTGMFSNQPLLGGRGFTRGFEAIQIATMDASNEVTQTAEDVTTNTLQLVDDFAGEAFMAFAHYVEPHQPYSPPENSAAGFDIDESDVSVAALSTEIDEQAVSIDDPRISQLQERYDAEIATVDNAIKALVDGLTERGLADNTIIIVTGSQGQEFLEHGYLGHAWTLFEEQLRVPLVFHAPGLLEPQRVASAVSLIDIYPTLVDLFDLELDTDSWPPDGGSFLNDTLDIRPSDEPIFAEFVVRERCVIRAAVLDEWKYIAEYIPCPVEERKEINDGYVETVRAIMAGEAEPPSIWGEIVNESLFNLNDDPGELNNLLDEAPEQLQYLRERLSDYETYSELYALQAMEDIVDPGLRQAMCGFGYGSC